MTHAIVTSADVHVGDFVLNHWYRSLYENVCLDNINVIVLDYGLTPEQRHKFIRAGVMVLSCVRNGHIACLRFLDLLRVLETKIYDQVLCVDGGDIIFQTDVSRLFEEHKTMFRAVCEQTNGPFIEWLYSEKNFKSLSKQEVLNSIRQRPMINCGFLLGPAQKFRNACEQFKDEMLTSEFGNDQIFFNYYLYKHGFFMLPETYNFTITTQTLPFKIVDGVFFDAYGHVIAVVHNSGKNTFSRPIKNFGYGRNNNKVKKVNLALMRAFWRSTQKMKQLIT